MTTLSSRSLRWTLTTTAIFACFAGSAHGFTVQTTHTYGDIIGASVAYVNVRESTATEAPILNEGETDSITARVVTDVRDPTVLYGQPTITGNVLSFEDSNFSSLAGTQTIGPADVTDGRLSFSLCTTGQDCPLQSDSLMYIKTLTLGRVWTGQPYQYELRCQRRNVGSDPGTCVSYGQRSRSR